MKPTQMYSTISVQRMALELARSPYTYVPLADSPTLEFAPVRPPRTGWLLLAALLVACGGGIYAARHRAPVLAAPYCDKHVQSCR